MFFLSLVNFLSRPFRAAFLFVTLYRKVTFQYISFTAFSLPALRPPASKVRHSGPFTLIICFRLNNIPICRGLSVTRHNISGMIPLHHDAEEVRKLAHSATIVPVRFATILMFHTVCGFLVHQQKRCNWCIDPFVLDYRAVTRIRGKHRLSGASYLHFPAYIRG